MNNNNLKDIYKNIKPKLDNDKLYNYRLLEFNELKEFKKGSHIKYIDDNNIIHNGGFIIDIKNSNSNILAMLILKSNIIWKLRFSKYKVYIKDITIYNNSKKQLYKFLEDDIKKKREAIKEKYSL